VSDNLELVHAIYADWERGDFSRSEWADPEIEFVITEGPNPGTWKGLEAMSRRYGEWLREWTDFRAEPEQFIVGEHDWILVLVRNFGRGRTSGYEFEQRSVANLFEFREGTVIRFVLYFDRDRARADLGLR
jgi:ketosteroid isomerase-like protein